MLNKAKTLLGYELRCLDGEVGSIGEFYFDNHHWAIRYLVVNTGNWLSGRHVLISPYALSAVNIEEQFVCIDLTQKQIAESPSLDSGKSVSQQFEESFNKHNEWPMYWNGPSVWGAYPYIERDREIAGELNPGEKAWDPDLRSTSVVRGYTIQASDGEIGQVEDFIIDDATWEIRYLVIDTPSRWQGKKVLISPRWIERVSWDQSKVFVNLSCDEIGQSPEYIEGTLLTRDYEIGLYQHYKHLGYWFNEQGAKEYSS